MFQKMKYFGASIFILVLFALDFSTSQSIEFRSEEESSCRTLSGTSGICVNIEQCQSLLKVIQATTEFTDSTLQLLRSLQCGFDGSTPMVCCENKAQESTTPVPTTSTANPEEESSEARTPPDVSEHINLRLLDHQRCGPVTQWKILNGNKTGVFQYPWMALIGYRIRTRTEFRCGGTVISQRYVLTAAHCVTQLPSGLTLTGVRLGDHDISKEQDCEKDKNGMQTFCAEPYQDFGIESSHFHPEYTRKSLHNDIGLIRLDRDADFRPSSVRPICLPIGPAATISQIKVVVTGWGATERGPQSNDLLQIFIGLVSNKDCARVYRAEIDVWYKQICAGGTNGTDTCFGDSGGPLQSIGTYNNNPRFVQYGITSFGPTKCGLKGFPSVYTNLEYYLNWILDTMKP